MTAGLLEVEETIEHLDPGDEVTCDVRDCETVAYWWATCRGCAHRSALCLMCAAHLELFHLLFGARCLLCGLAAASLHGVMKLEPIGGRS